MPPRRTSLDPEGYYARLGIDPLAAHADIVAAFRAKARILHPDMSGTGDAAAFVAVKLAYDVLSNRVKRAEYDRAAAIAALDAIEPEILDIKPSRTAFGARRPAAPSGPASPAGGRPGRAGQTAKRPEASGFADVFRGYGADKPGYGGSPYGYEGPIPGTSKPSETGRAAFSAEQAAAAPLARPPRLSDLPLVLWTCIAAFTCLCLVEVAWHIRSPDQPVPDGIKPNAAPVAPLPATAHFDMLYGAPPVRLPGTPDIYIVPNAAGAVLWREDAEHKKLVAAQTLPAFSMMQAVRLDARDGMLAVLTEGPGVGFVEAARVTPGNAAAARRAYCTYNAGPSPVNGEVLQHPVAGEGRVRLENRSSQPAVVKLRDPSGAVALSVYLAPGGHADMAALPEGSYRPDFALGELWSRACDGFAAGMRARRVEPALRIPGASVLQIAADTANLPSADIPDTAFEQK